MHRIPDEYFETVIYLYRSKAELEQGIVSGGSGFLVSLPSQVKDMLFILCCYK